MLHPVPAVGLGTIKGSIGTAAPRPHLTVELAPRFIPFAGNWQEIREHCLQVMQPCILQDKDAILPALGDTGSSESLLVGVSADEHGAKLVASRILEQLERSELLKANCVFTVSSVGLKLPSQQRQEPVQKFVQEVADNITEMSMTTFRRRQSAMN